MAFPVLTAFVGGMVGYSLSTAHDLNVEEALIWRQFAKDIGLGGFVGLLVGLVISLFALAGLEHVKVEDDPKYKDKRKTKSGERTPSMVTKAYTKEDLEDHKKSTTKVLSKLKEKAEAEKVERTQILESGTRGIEEKRRAELGLKSVANTKSISKKPGTGK